jgi:hypothetical protein
MTRQSPLTPNDVLRGLSLGRRVAHTVAGLGGLLGAGLGGLLWATEPTPLPARTQAAFAAMIVVGLTWAGLAVWALAHRPLFAVDRVIAATLALGFSTLSTVWGAVLAWNRAGLVGLVTVGGVGLALALASAALLVRARAYRATLRQRQGRLEHGPATGASDPVLLPIGPLALGLRLRRDNPATRTVAVLVLVLAAALLAGLALLLR